MRAGTDWGHPPGYGNGTGVLVLAGSSGRVDTERVDMLAARGVTALGLRWFGGDGQPRLPREVPLETFFQAIDELSARCDRVVVMGLSYGAEAALLAAGQDHRIDAVVAFAPTDVVWEGDRTTETEEERSKWTLGGEPLPFVPISRSAEAPSGKPAFVDTYVRSRESCTAARLRAAQIPVESIRGEVLLVAGGDDKVWDSAPSAHRIAARREAAGRETSLVIDERAGHPVVLPGEPAADLDRPYQVGGDVGASERLGHAAWPHVSRILGLTN